MWHFIYHICSIFMYLCTSILYYVRNIFDMKSAMLFCRLVFQLSHCWCRVQKYSTIVFFMFLLFFMSNNTIIHFWKQFNISTFFFVQKFQKNFSLLIFLPCLSFSYHKRIIFQCFKLYFTLLLYFFLLCHWVCWRNLQLI